MISSYGTRIPLVIALSSALVFAVGCDNRVDDRNVDDRATMQPADEEVTPSTPADPMAQDDATYSADAPQDEVMDDGRRSDQPVDDTWITTKVKSSLLADSDVGGLRIDVETVNGVVTLSGQVKQQSQIEHAARIAREIKGVTDVRTTDLTVDAN